MVEIDDKQGFSIIQKAKETGSIKLGVNEVTKAIERGQAKAVFVANDVSPAEIVAHIIPLSNEMGIVSSQIGSKEELGSAAQIKSTTCIGIIDAGNGKKELDKIIAEYKEEKESAKEKKSKKDEDSSKEEKKEDLENKDSQDKKEESAN